MIQANELRLGNWVSIMPHGSGPFMLDEDRIEILFGARNFSDLYPIPLSPEILEKCGFVTPDMYQETVKINDVVMLDIHKGKILLRDNRRIELLYLHQLQNLYFSLVGTELTVNL